MKFVVYEESIVDCAPSWGWRLYDGSGLLLARSAGRFQSVDACLAGIALVMRVGRSTPIVDADSGQSLVLH